MTTFFQPLNYPTGRVLTTSQSHHLPSLVCQVLESLESSSPPSLSLGLPAEAAELEVVRELCGEEEDGRLLRFRHLDEDLLTCPLGQARRPDGHRGEALRDFPREVFQPLRPRSGGREVRGEEILTSGQDGRVILETLGKPSG